MNSLQTIVLSIVQGITELLPISSTGHVLLTSKLFFQDIPNLLLLSILQFGSVLAVILYFRKTLFQNLFSIEKLSLYLKILLGSIPTIIIALSLESLVEKYFHTNIAIVISLIFWGIIMIIVENTIKGEKTKEISEITFTQSIIMGIAQSIAVIPGTSRSGVTTLMGIISGTEKYTAIQFSFLLGIPILVGSFGYEMVRNIDDLSNIINVQFFIGILFSFLFSYLSIIVLEKFSKRKFLTFFGIYRIVLGAILALVLL